MLQTNGEEKLRAYAEREFPKQLLKVSERVYHALSYGHSNATIIIAANSVILVDTLNSRESGARLKAEIENLTDKPVKTIIYTHSHPDHRGGSGVFRDTVEEIIAFAPVNKPLKYNEKIMRGLGARTMRQFGYNLSDEELITQGIGVREDKSGYEMLPATTIYDEDIVEREIDGVKLKLVRAPGETDDQIFVWLEEEKALCSGDNYYACWPNLYAIRGSSYRDVAAWVDSLGKMLEYNTEYLLPGHTRPIVGADKVREVLTNYRAAIESVLLQTLECIEKGMGLDEAVNTVKLPPESANLPYLGEHYGSIDWSVRSIYAGYVGWFDGAAVNLHRLSAKERANELIPALGGAERVSTMIKKAQEAQKWQWSLELCEIFLALEDSEEVLQLKIKALRELAKLETSANGRHYYLVSAYEAEEKLK